MADYHNANEFRASSAGFAWGDLIFTDRKSACLRKVLIQSRAIQAPVDNKYRVLGEHNENRHATRLAREGKKHLREVKFNRPIHSGVTLSGHADFIVYDAVNPVCVDELKSVSSKNVKRDVIANGHYITENLAQLVTYMLEARTTLGRLIYTYYETDSNTREPQAMDERTFHVKIDEDGRIFVDGTPSQWTAMDVLKHQRHAAYVIKDGLVWQRPYRAEMPFAGSCHWCPFKEACRQYDEGLIEGTDAFVNLAKSLITGESHD